MQLVSGPNNQDLSHKNEQIKRLPTWEGKDFLVEFDNSIENGGKIGTPGRALQCR